MFIYPEFEDGVKVVSRMHGDTASMMQNITIYQIKKGEEVELLDPGCEMGVSGFFRYNYNTSTRRKFA